MIQISETLALTLYFAGFLLSLLFLWLFTNGQKKVLLPPLSVLHVCEYCQYAYLERASKQITTCPQCHSFNKK